MAYQEKTTQSWSSRLSGAFSGIFMGALMFIGATMLLYWNEGRTVATRDAIGEASAQLVEMRDVSKVDSAFNGQVVHAIGTVQTKEQLSDTDFGIQVNAIRLKRKVEYYQWLEESRSSTEKKLGGGTETVTTYTYKKGWTSSPVDSTNFRDPEYQGENRVLFTLPDLTQNASQVTLGAYRLPDFLVDSIQGDKPLDVKVHVEKLKSQFGTGRKSKSNSNSKNIYSGGNVVYFGADPAVPAIGDVRATFSVMPAESTVSLIAKVRNDTFDPFIASNGTKFSMLDIGDRGAEIMLAGQVAGNKTMAWILRGIGVLLCIMGLASVLAPLSVLTDVLPFLGSIVGMGTRFVAAALGVSWSLLIIAIAWIRFRPLLAISLIALSVGVLGFLYYRKKVKREL